MNFISTLAEIFRNWLSKLPSLLLLSFFCALTVLFQQINNQGHFLNIYLSITLCGLIFLFFFSALILKTDYLVRNIPFTDKQALLLSTKKYFKTILVCFFILLVMAFFTFCPVVGSPGVIAILLSLTLLSRLSAFLTKKGVSKRSKKIWLLIFGLLAIGLMLGGEMPNLLPLLFILPLAVFPAAALKYALTQIPLHPQIYLFILPAVYLCVLPLLIIASYTIASFYLALIENKRVDKAIEESYAWVKPHLLPVWGITSLIFILIYLVFCIPPLFQHYLGISAIGMGINYFYYLILLVILPLITVTIGVLTQRLQITRQAV